MKKVVFVVIISAFLGLYVLSCTHDTDPELYQFGIDNGEIEEDDINGIDNEEVKDSDI